MAAEIAGGFGGGVWWVDLAPITDPDLVPVAVIRALGLPDQPRRSTMDMLLRLVGDRRMLLVLDNCEHLLDASAALVVALLGGCPAVTGVATSREPIRVAGEVSWRVRRCRWPTRRSSCSPPRATGSPISASATTTPPPRRRSACASTACRWRSSWRRRGRVWSLTEIRASLHDRFRLLTGGDAPRCAASRRSRLGGLVARAADRARTRPVRRLAAFMGGFDLDAARRSPAAATWSAPGPRPAHLLVDKSLVVAGSASGRTRYRLLETVRQYALEKLGESGKPTPCARHRDYYSSMAALLDSPARTG